MAKVDHERQRYPACIVWTPIPCLTWLFPFIGHMGIATSEGVIRDFAGPYYVSEDHMAFGVPTKYWPLDPELGGGAASYDRAVAEASEMYKAQLKFERYLCVHKLFLNMWAEIVDKLLSTYRVFHIKGPKVIAYYSKNRSLRDFQSLLGAHQMWSIC